MSKGAILSLLVAGLVTGGYVEVQLNQSDGSADSQIIEAIEWTEAIPEIPVEPVEPSPPVIEELQPPPPPPGPEREEARARRELSEAPTFTPFTVAPSITNRQEVVSAMVQAYPPLLRDAGIGGTIRVYFFIEADGTVGSVQLDQSSGHAPLDEAALRVADVYRFSPALNREEPVPVWVSFPITFQVR